MKNRIRSLIGIALVAAGCGRGGGAAPAPAAPPPVPMPPPVQLYYDNAGGIRDSSRVVIRDAAKLGEYWQQATSTQVSPPPVPQLDFAREMAILVAAPEFLGLLRENFSVDLRRIIDQEFSLDLCQMKPQEIRSHLPEALFGAAAKI